MGYSGSSDKRSHSCPLLPGTSCSTRPCTQSYVAGIGPGSTPHYPGTGGNKHGSMDISTAEST